MHACSTTCSSGRPLPTDGFGRLKRKEDPRFIRGQGHYVDDVKLPGMLHLDIVRSPFAHAKITAIHTEKALAIPGVACVVTAEDVPGAATYGLISADQPVFARDEPACDTRRMRLLPQSAA